MVNYTEHQIACVRKVCDRYMEGGADWAGCKFPEGPHPRYPCPTHSPCREEIEGGLRMARITPEAPSSVSETTAHQESAGLTSNAGPEGSTATRPSPQAL